MGTFIIAEIGVNHNGSLELAKKLIEKAVWAGVDAVKFQTFVAEKSIAKNTKKAEYQIKTTGDKETQLDMVKKFELKFSDFKILKKFAEDLNVVFLSSPFDFFSINFLNKLGLTTWKIPSGEITNLPYLRMIGKLQKKVIMSTGMANLAEIETALNVLREFGTTDITVLHCNTEYPTPMDDVNLKAMQTIRDAFKVKVGYSDHTQGIEIPIAAVAMGAEVIEKHFTLDKTMEGPDHRASLEPEEFKMMVDSIRNIEKALGDGIKKPSRSEIKNKAIVRKSIVAARYIKKGESFSEDNLTVKRPGIGISPMEWNNIIGKTAQKDFKEDEMIEL